MNNKFLQWIDNWYKNLTSVNWSEIVDNPQKTALIAVDLTNGFCHKGNLASKSVAEIIPDSVDLFKLADSKKVSKFLLIQDAHHPEASEFATYPPHCIKGSQEAETIPQLLQLSFSSRFEILEKNSISSSSGTALDSWILHNKNIDTFLIAGDCTDICVYLLAIHLKTSADAINLKRKIIIPANCVATYDLGIKKARELGSVPHDAETLHKIFLYQMMLNGMEVVGRIK